MKFRFAGILFALSVLTFLLLTGFQKSEPSKKQTEINLVCISLDSALLAADTVKLDGLLHKQLSLGHSNGLIENKQLLFEHLRSGYLKYNSIVEEGSKDIAYEDQMARVRRQIKVAGALNGQEFNIKLGVLEVWLKKDKKWKLWSRQSVKIN